MKYFFDTEFLEGKQDKTILGFKYGETKPTIDLISIGIVAEDCREYYAISKEFNLREAWNRYDLKETEYTKGFGYETEKEVEKIYWLRENVLRHIWLELSDKEHNKFLGTTNQKPIYSNKDFTFNDFKRLINKYGKTNKEITDDVIEFCKPFQHKDSKTLFIDKPEFYAYYADYDWVVFCWLFGLMKDLPSGFPYYCNDLIQDSYRVADKYVDETLTAPIVSSDWHSNYCINELKQHPLYPKQINEHNALADARWNKELYRFLKRIENE